MFPLIIVAPNNLRIFDNSDNISFLFLISNNFLNKANLSFSSNIELLNNIYYILQSIVCNIYINSSKLIFNVFNMAC